MYIDTHTHIHYPDFDNERENLIEKLKEQEIFTVVIGTDINSSQRAIDFTNEYVYAKATVGYHPNDHNICSQENWNNIVKLAKEDCVVGIGETGIDLYRDASEKNSSNQIELFHKHINLAITLDKTLVIHSREAFPQVEKVLNEYKNMRIIFHCYTGNRQWMERLSTLSHDVYFSYSGIVTFKNNVEEIQEAAKHTSIEKILTETDSPYLAPVPFRGQRNDSTLLPYVTHFLADLRGTERQKLRDQVFKNALNAFRNLI